MSGEEFPLMHCQDCSFIFTQDAPREEAVGTYYDTEDYVEHSDTHKGLVFSLYHYGRKLMLRRKRQLVGRQSGGKKLLDIGSASGYFLNHMRQRGYEVSGVEVSQKARRLCEAKFGISAFDPEWFLNEDQVARFDLITLWHVFEHVYRLGDYMDAFQRSLEPGGALIIAMPNHRSFDAKYYKEHWNAWDVPRHLWHFNPATFKRFAADHGFEIRSTYRLPLDPFYNALVSADYKPGFRSSLWAGLVGGVSWAWSILNKERASSLVYVLRKTNS